MPQTVAGVRASRSASGWIRRHRALAIGLAATMLAAIALVAFIATRPGPEDLVRDYLEVLRAKDADAAREYVSEVQDFDTAADALLVGEAMSGDWKVTELATRHESDHVATVDVTITATDETTRNGRFDLDTNGPDGWRIVNPLVKLDLSRLPLRYAEFNGTVADARTLEASIANADAETQPGAAVWLFPGAYTPYGDSAAGLELAIGTYVALPSTDSGEKTAAQRFLPEITPSDTLTAEANAQLADWIDECAESTEINPKGCPFAGGSDSDRRRVSLDNGDDYITDEVEWKVKTYPKIRLLQTAGSFNVQEVEPGEMIISGTGNGVHDDGPKQDFTGGCDIKLRQAVADLVEPEVFEFRGGHDDVYYTCSLRYE